MICFYGRHTPRRMVGVAGKRRGACPHAKHVFIECIFLLKLLMSESGGTGLPALPDGREEGAGLLPAWFLMDTW